MNSANSSSVRGSAASGTAPTRVQVTRWLLRTTSHLLPWLIVAVLVRIAQLSLSVALIVIPILAFEQPRWTLGGVIAAMAAIAVLKAALRYAEQYAGHWVAFSSLAHLRGVFFEALAPQAPAATIGRSAAELSERGTRDVDRVEVFFAHTLPPAIASAVVPVITLAWLSTQVPGEIILVISGAAILTVAVIPALTVRRSWQSAQQQVAARAKLSGHVGESLQGLNELIAFEYTERRLGEQLVHEAELSAGLHTESRLAALRQALLLVVQWAQLVVIVALGVFFDLDWLGVALAVVVALALVPALRGVDDFVSSLDASFASATRIYEVVTAEPAVRSTSDRRPEWDSQQPRLGLEEVSFGFTPNREVLRDVTTEVRPGQWLHLVGATGSGKSTLAMLSVRTWDVGSGQICAAGSAINDLDLDALREGIVYVPQRPYLAPGALGAALRLGAPDATDSQVWEALELVNLTQWARGNAAGLDHALGERGASVSGGQRQRLALAAALLASPRVLIIDEALSQLDAVTGGHVRQGLARWLRAEKSRAILEVTHHIDRLPADAEVLVLDSGRIVETGRAEQLASADGPFAQLLARVV